MIRDQEVAPDYISASASAISAGNNMMMASPPFFDAALSALNEGLIMIRNECARSLDMLMFSKDSANDGTFQAWDMFRGHQAILFVAQ